MGGPLLYIVCVKFLAYLEIFINEKLIWISRSESAPISFIEFACSPKAKIDSPLPLENLPWRGELWYCSWHFPSENVSKQKCSPSVMQQMSNNFMS